MTSIYIDIQNIQRNWDSCARLLKTPVKHISQYQVDRRTVYYFCVFFLDSFISLSVKALVYLLKKEKALVDFFSKYEYIDVTIGAVWRWDRGHSACSGQPVAQEAEAVVIWFLPAPAPALEYEYHTDQEVMINWTW